MKFGLHEKIPLYGMLLAVGSVPWLTECRSGEYRSTFLVPWVTKGFYGDMRGERSGVERIIQRYHKAIATK